MHGLCSVPFRFETEQLFIVRSLRVLHCQWLPLLQILNRLICIPRDFALVHVALVFFDELRHFDLFFALVGKTCAAGRIRRLLRLVDHLADHFFIVFEGLACVVGLQVDLGACDLVLQVRGVLPHVFFLVAQQLSDVFLVVVRIFTRVERVLHLLLLEERVRVYIENLLWPEAV